jgi:hypothetical protein
VVGAGDYSLIEAYNGSVWTTVSSPHKGDGGYLYGVSCPAASECFAAGFYQTVKTEIDKTLIESG